jgi:hypothetical protein
MTEALDSLEGRIAVSAPERGGIRPYIRTGPPTRL